MVEALVDDLAILASLADGVRVVAPDLPFATGLAGLRLSVPTIHLARCVCTEYLTRVGFGLGMDVGRRGMERAPAISCRGVGSLSFGIGGYMSMYITT